MKQKISAEEIGKEFVEAILQWCAPNETIECRKKFNIEKDLEETFNLRERTAGGVTGRWGQVFNLDIWNRTVIMCTSWQGHCA